MRCDRPLGHPLELVPLTNPVTESGPSKPIRVRVLFEKQPLANARVSFSAAGWNEINSCQVTEEEDTLHGTFVIDRHGKVIFANRGYEPFVANQSLLHWLADHGPVAPHVSKNSSHFNAAKFLDASERASLSASNSPTAPSQRLHAG